MRRYRVFVLAIGFTIAIFVASASVIGASAAQNQNCDKAYPTVCIAPPPPDLDCKDIPYRNFKVLQPDPHRFDRDKDGIGCEKKS